MEALKAHGLKPETDRLEEILGQGDVTATNGREVDLLTFLPGMSFEEAWAGHMQVRYRGVEISVISRADQIRLLRATNRRQDREDAEVLESMDPEG